MFASGRREVRYDLSFLRGENLRVSIIIIEPVQNH